MGAVIDRLIVLDGAPVPAQPAVKVGDSFFESWYSLYNPEGKSTKQTMREAYEAGLIDHEGRPDRQPSAVPEAVAKDAAKEIVSLIVRDLCETEPANPDDPDSVCVSVDELRMIVSRHVIGEDAAILSAADTEVKNGARN